MNKNLLDKIVPKFLQHDFNREFGDLLIEYFSEGTILGNLARIGKNINCCENNYENAVNDNNSNYIYDVWQFGDDDE